MRAAYETPRKEHTWEMNAEQVRILAETIGVASLVRVTLTPDQQSAFVDAYLKNRAAS